VYFDSNRVCDRHHNRRPAGAASDQTRKGYPLAKLQAAKLRPDLKLKLGVRKKAKTRSYPSAFVVVLPLSAPGQ